MRTSFVKQSQYSDQFGFKVVLICCLLGALVSSGALSFLPTYRSLQPQVMFTYTVECPNGTLSHTFSLSPTYRSLQLQVMFTYTVECPNGTLSHIFSLSPTYRRLQPQVIFRCPIECPIYFSFPPPTRGWNWRLSFSKNHMFHWSVCYNEGRHHIFWVSQLKS